MGNYIYSFLQKHSWVKEIGLRPSRLRMSRLFFKESRNEVNIRTFPQRQTQLETAEKVCNVTVSKTTGYKPIFVLFKHFCSEANLLWTAVLGHVEP